MTSRDEITSQNHRHTFYASYIWREAMGSEKNIHWQANAMKDAQIVGEEVTAKEEKEAAS
jgi:hypothetical protein